MKDNKQVYLDLIDILAENMSEEEVYKIYQFALCVLQQEQDVSCPSPDEKKQIMHL